MGCCDCALVHKMEFKLVKLGAKSTQIWFRAWRDEKETKYLRKKSNVKIKHKYE